MEDDRKMEKMLRYAVGAEDIPCTVGVLLQNRLGLTKHQIRSAKFRRDGICVNGIQTRVTAPLKTGDVLEVILEHASDCGASMEAAEKQLEILYEDEDLLLVNKQAGIPVHPGHGHYRDTLANYLLYYFGQKGYHVTVRAVGRLDRETSGIVVFAKNKVAASRLAGGSVKKEYTALVLGHLAEKTGCIELPIGKRKDSLNRMEISEAGAFARTHFKVLEEYRESSLVQLRLDTGRTHQIRVHMAALGHPLLGDLIYGEEPGERDKGIDNTGDFRKTVRERCGDSGLQRAALHCGQVEVIQPFTGDKIRCTAPLPKDMIEYIEWERQNNYEERIQRNEKME